MPLLELQAMTRSYGSRRGVVDVSFAVDEGSIFGFLGPNGAGKTTTIRVLLGLLRPGSGAARVFGLDCWRDTRKIKAEVGYVPGDLRLYSWMNGHTAIRIVSSVRGRDARKHAAELAEMFDLDLGVKVRSMSRGMRQKLGLILALAHSPRLVILDEPSSALDPLMQEVLRRHLRAMASRGHTVFFSSHTLSEVEDLCKRVAILRDGRIVVDQPLESLRRQAGYVVVVRWKSGAAGVRENAGENEVDQWTGRPARTGVPISPGGTPGPLVLPGDVPPAFSITNRDPSMWTGIWRGEPSDLIEWLRGKPIDDLSITRPDLETLFREYYAIGPSTSRPSNPTGASPVDRASGGGGQVP